MSIQTLSPALWLRPIWAFWLLLLVSSAAHADRKVALVLANDAYQVGRLSKPPEDAREIASALEAVGFAVTVVSNANQNIMKRSLRDFGSAARGADLAIFYYSGHGTQVAGENYLIPIDASIQKEADYEIEAVNVHSLMRQLAVTGPKVAVVVLDACRDNPHTTTSRATTKGLTRMDAPTGVMIAYATAPNMTAADNGIYAKTLAKYIRTPGLELLEIFRKASAEVRQLSKGVQEPRISEVSVNESVYLHMSKETSSVVAHPATAKADAFANSGVDLGQPCDLDLSIEKNFWACRFKGFRNSGENCEDGLRRVTNLAINGNTNAMVWLAQRHDANDNDDGGKCLRKSSIESEYWWGAAVRAGDHWASCQQGHRTKDPEQAAAIFRRVGKCPNVSLTGLHYADRQDFQNAVVFAQIASNDGDRQGINLLAYLYERGLGGLPKDQTKARSLYRQSAELGHTDGMYNFAVFLEGGIGGWSDRDQAITWYRKAADAGSNSAKIRLGQLSVSP